MTQSGHRVLVTGGVRSGKSDFAEDRFADVRDVLYVATGPRPSSTDIEWSERVRLHRERRPATWRTLETDDLSEVLARVDESPVLIDCLGNWLTSAMESAGCWDVDESGTGKAQAAGKLALSVADLLDAWRASSRQVIAVTNEVGSGIVPETASGRWFRDELGRLNSAIARASEEVWLVTVGIGQRLK